MWNKKPTRCHLVLYLFLLYKLLNMFRATLCPSSGADDLVVFFLVWCSAMPCCATYSPIDKQPANRIWLLTQPRNYTTREKIPLSRQLLKLGTRWPETWWATCKGEINIIISDIYFYGTVHHLYSCVKRKPNWCHLFYYLFNTHSMLIMFRPLIRPSSGVCD